MSRDYFLFLGTISFLRPALLDQCKAYGPLLDICNYQNRSDLMKLLLSTLDFGHNIPCRVILSKILTSTDKVELFMTSSRHSPLECTCWRNMVIQVSVMDMCICISSVLSLRSMPALVLFVITFYCAGNAIVCYATYESIAEGQDAVLQ